MNSKRNSDETSSVQLTLIVFFGIALLAQYFLLFNQFTLSSYVPSSLNGSILITAVCIGGLWLVRRHLFSIQLCMAISAIAFGGLGMGIGHTLGAYIHGNHSVAHQYLHIGWIYYLVHYLPMVFLCSESCRLIGRYYHHKWPQNLCHWRCHLLALPWMVVGMLIAQKLFELMSTNPNEHNVIGAHIFSSVGMGLGTAGYYYFRCKTLVESKLKLNDITREG